MSRLTASPFHKPSVFNFPRAPLSPPDTSTELAGPSVSVAGGPDHSPPQSDVHHHRDHAPPHVAESPAARFRRVSSLAYNSHQAYSRDRALHRNKAFVIVLPPPTLLQEHGQLGHTLASGPSHRLSQGLLMPLFPTMYAQLTAIAKEFNFPSTTGICLYLQYTDHGVTVSPRISDDSWQLIWSHVFETTAPHASLAPPISGKIEFDIDVRIARWYGSWLSSAAHGHPVEYHITGVHSTTPSTHFRDNSGTTAEERQDDDLQESTIMQPSTRHRHVPRALSLVDRLETMSMRSAPRHAALSPPEVPAQASASKTLSPVFQAEEPADFELEQKVESWLETAVANPNPLAGTGQISLDPSNMPNTIVLDGTEEEDEELRLEDYEWELSTHGPLSYGSVSPVSWRAVQSVHLANRIEPSVCLSPSVCTSFGPSDYTLDSPLWYTISDRALSPDLAHRMYEDCPPTPGTATSWGAPSYRLDSPFSEEYPLSIDLGQRAVFSPPMSPATATTWGAPLSWPPSPVVSERPLTPDIAHRVIDGRAADQQPWRFGWPYYRDESPAPVWKHVWPFHQPSDTQSFTAERTLAGPPSLDVTVKPWNYGWPYHRSSVNEETVKPWGLVWPQFIPSPDVDVRQRDYVPASTGTGASAPWQFVWPLSPSRDVVALKGAVSRSTIVVRLPAIYPVFDLYPAVYPGNLDCIYPPKTLETSRIAAVQYPTFDLYPAVNAKPRSVLSARTRSAQYPDFDLYPSVNRVKTTQYPDFDLYPSQAIAPGRRVLATGYPDFDLYPATSKKINEGISGYPHFVLYPPMSTRKTGHSIRATGYPDFDLYPAHGSSSKQEMTGYPHFVLYPPIIAREGERRPSMRTTGYPDFDLYPALGSKIKQETSGYPNFVLYPPVNTRKSEMRRIARATGYPDFDLYPALTSGSKMKQETSGYPNFVLYPLMNARKSEMSRIARATGYPDFDLYPALTSEIKSETSGYPCFILYPPVSSKNGKTSPRVRTTGYPDFDLYPAIGSRTQQKTSGYPDFVLYPPVSARKCITARTAGYPDFDLYPAIGSGTKSETSGYPHFVLYPPVDHSRHKTPSKPEPVFVSHYQYPAFSLYPVQYPFFDLYPGLALPKKANVVKATNIRCYGYPSFNLYPVSGYPHFDLYHESHRLNPKPVNLPQKSYQSQYPLLVLYPAVYPHFNLYPTVHGPGNSLVRRQRRTHAELHVMVMAHQIPRPKHQRKSHNQLHNTVFESGYIPTPSGPLRVPAPSGEPTVQRRSSGRTRSGSVLKTSLPTQPNGSVMSKSPRTMLPPLEERLNMLDRASPLLSPPSKLESDALRRLSTGSRTIINGPRPNLSSVDERTTGTKADFPVSTRKEDGVSVQRSNSGSRSHSKRDSLVLQRIKALNSASEETGDVVSKFPMPPRLPQRSVSTTGAYRTAF